MNFCGIWEPPHAMGAAKKHPTKPKLGFLASLGMGGWSCPTEAPWLERHAEPQDSEFGD